MRDSINDSRRHRIHPLILHSISLDPILRQVLILRGAAALALFHGGHRITDDLDFVVLRLPKSIGEAGELTPELVGPRLNDALNRHLRPAAGKMGIGDDVLKAMVKIDLAAAETICDCVKTRLPGIDDPAATVNVATLEEIIAEKLGAILVNLPGSQKKREQDLFDVADAIGLHDAKLDRKRIAELATVKTSREGGRFSAAAFNDEVRARVAMNYPRLRESTGDHFIEFDRAWKTLTGFVAQLAPLRT